MSCNSAIYAVNTAEQTIGENITTTINFGAPDRRFGNALNMSGGNVEVNGYGFYEVIVFLAITPNAGEVTIQILNNGVPVPGKTLTFTSAGALNIITLPCIVREKCGCSQYITVTVTAEAGATVSDATIEVVKL